MQFKTIIRYIDIYTGEVLNITGEEFKRNYDFKKSKEKSIVKDNLCTLIYIYEGNRKKQLELKFNDITNSVYKMTKITTAIETTPLKDGEELITSEQIGIFRLVKNKVKNSVELGIGEVKISSGESEEELRKFATMFDNKMINTIITLVEFLIKNQENLNKKLQD